MQIQVLPRVVRVVVADDHNVVRQGIRAVLEYSDGIEVVGEASNGVELLEQVAQHSPDVVLVDVDMRPMDGLEAVRRLSESHPEVKALMLSAHEDSQLFDQSIRAGAAGYLFKTIKAEDMALSIHAAAAGEPIPDPYGLKRGWRLSTAGQWPVERPVERLTDRELEVLKLVAAGKSNKEIARKMGIGSQTVKTHVSHILAKLGAPDRAGAVALAFRKGLVI